MKMRLRQTGIKMACHWYVTSIAMHAVMKPIPRVDLISHYLSRLARREPYSWVVLRDGLAYREEQLRNLRFVKSKPMTPEQLTDFCERMRENIGGQRSMLAPGRSINGATDKASLYDYAKLHRLMDYEEMARGLTGSRQPAGVMDALEVDCRAKQRQLEREGPAYRIDSTFDFSTGETTITQHWPDGSTQKHVVPRAQTSASTEPWLELRGDPVDMLVQLDRMEERLKMVNATPEAPAGHLTKYWPWPEADDVASLRRTVPRWPRGWKGG